MLLRKASECVFLSFASPQQVVNVSFNLSNLRILGDYQNVRVWYS